MHSTTVVWDSQLRYCESGCALSDDQRYRQFAARLVRSEALTDGPSNISAATVPLSLLIMNDSWERFQPNRIAKPKVTLTARMINETLDDRRYTPLFCAAFTDQLQNIRAHNSTNYCA